VPFEAAELLPEVQARGRFLAPWEPDPFVVLPVLDRGRRHGIPAHSQGGGRQGVQHEYVRLVEAYREGGTTKQRAVCNLGRKDLLAARPR
jgi:hypothetical protein